MRMMMIDWLIDNNDIDDGSDEDDDDVYDYDDDDKWLID